MFKESNELLCSIHGLGSEDTPDTTIVAARPFMAWTWKSVSLRYTRLHCIGDLQLSVECNTAASQQREISDALRKGRSSAEGLHIMRKCSTLSPPH